MQEQEDFTIPKRNSNYMFGEFKNDKEFMRQAQWLKDTLKAQFDIDIDLFYAINLAGLQRLIVNALYEITVNGAGYDTEGDKKQFIMKKNPVSDVYIDAVKLLNATYRELGLTPRARAELDKMKAEAEATNSTVTGVFEEYMKNGLPK